MFKKILIVCLLLVTFACFSFAAKPQVASNSTSIEVFKAGTNIFIPEGKSVQSAVSIGGDLTIAGTVNDSAAAVGGNILLKKTAIVRGDVISVGGKITKQEGAYIMGKTTEVNISQIPSIVVTKEWEGYSSVFNLFYIIAFLILAVFIVAFFATQIGRASYYCERKPVQSFLWGLVTFLLMPIGGLLLIVSLIGIVFIPVYVLLLVAAGFFGYVAMSQLFGKKIFQILNLKNKPMMFEAAVGLIIFEALGLIPIVGWFIKLIVVTMGIGAVAITRFGIRD